MSTFFDRSATANTLWDAIQDGQCVVWIGSGLSKAVYPDLDEFLPVLCAECGVPMIGTDDFMPIAESCKMANPNAYYRTLATRYGAETNLTRVEYNSLVALKFRGYITTNFDPLLWKACQNSGIRVFRYPDLRVLMMNGQQRPAYYIHGAVYHPDDREVANLVLAKSDFDDGYDRCIGGFVQEVLKSCPIIFVGCGLREGSLRAVFRRVKETTEILEGLSRGEPPPLRLVLQADRTLSPEYNGDLEIQRRVEGERQRFAELGIKTLPYPHDPNYLELDRILQAVVDIQTSASSVKESREPKL